MKNQTNKAALMKPRRQSGAALLIAMVVLASMAAFYLLNNSGSISSRLVQKVNQVASLAEAKKALIAYAVSYIDSHDGDMGFMPCPDMNENGIIFEGGSDNCDAGGSNNSVIGRFPWRSLDIKPLRDGANECLWYAVSGAYKNTTLAVNKTGMLNDDSNGVFEIYDAEGSLINGTVPEERVVAVILAPGAPLGQQNRAGFIDSDEGTRVCRGGYDATQYLEGNGDIDNSTLSGVADTIDRFIKSGTQTETAETPFNDKIAIVTQRDIWSAVKRRRDYEATIENLTASIANCIADYGNAGGGARNLPWPAELNLGGADYRDDVSYADIAAPASLLGRLPENVSNSEAQLEANASDNTGTGGVSVIGPPSCIQCKEKYDKYIEELGEELADFRLDVDKANTDYQLCLGNPNKTKAQCDVDLAQDLAAAQTKYDQEIAEITADELQDYYGCLSKHSCSTTGGGSTSDCTDCQTDFDAAVAEAVKKLDKSKGAIPGQFTSCVSQAKGNANKIQACEAERDKEIADADEDYAEDMAEAQAIYDLCNTVNSCPSVGGSKGIQNILNGCLSTEEFTLWQHWKDHFFYVVSGSYAPDSTNVACSFAGAKCVKTNGNRHAGIVFFSGERQPGIMRNGPVAGDTDTKNIISNYLEGANVGAAFPNPADATGSRSYDPDAGNDYLYCINNSDPMTTGVCP